VSFVDSWGAPRSGGRRHQGVDMLAAAGTRLVAVEAGHIRWAGRNTLGGLGLSIAGTSGARYYYAHLSARYVAAGARVARGQLVGRVGTSGNAAGGPPHLHFEIRPTGHAKVNPYPYVRRWCG
jgi:peptidoglycan LD-endopeptidase LytH